MKIMKDEASISALKNDLKKTIDTMVYCEFECPKCSQRIKTTEAIINRSQENLFELYIKILERTIEDIDYAVVEVYGCDPRRELLNKKIGRIIDDAKKPKITLIPKY